MERAAAMTDMYDQALLGILQHVGNVQEFLNILFGFLYRKTDFYRLLLQPTDRLGFPPGVAKTMTLKAFKTFEHLAHQDEDRRQHEMEEKLRKREKDLAVAGEKMKVPAVAEEVEVNSAVEHDSALDNAKAAESQEAVVAEEQVDAQATNAVVEPSVPVAAPLEAQPAELPRRPDAQDETQILWPPNEKEGLPGEEPNAGNNRWQKKKGTAEDEVAGWSHQGSGSLLAPEVSKHFRKLESARKQEQFQANPDSYNGAVRENYVWSQDYSDVEIKVPVPKHIRKGRQVSVDIGSNSIHVAVVEGNGYRVLMEGTLTHKINTENSVWSMEPGKCILESTFELHPRVIKELMEELSEPLAIIVNKSWKTGEVPDDWRRANVVPIFKKGKKDEPGNYRPINLSKVGEYWWSAILEGEEQIDIDKINKERSMATVDEEEHAVLDRLSFDYHQKLQGKPQSHEMKVHEMLKKGWDAEGSPFRGQKFDPSMFNISPGAVHF
ncbi:NudC domain-containing protein 3 [Varanus komodoensis]|nr:NudC domain-containing protein 3 [Varanus komodoensis]